MDSGGGKSEMELLRNKLKTYTKRIKGLQKKIYEFSTLVGVDAVMIAYRTKKGNNRLAVVPDTYPENLRDVIPVVKRYLGIPKLERTKRHKQFAGDDNGNVLDIVRENNNDNAADGLEWDDGYDELSVDQIEQLVDSVESKMEELEEQIQIMENKENGNPNSFTSGAKAAAATTTTTSGMQMQQAYVLQPLNQNLAGHQQMNLANGSAMVNGFGSNVMVMQYPMMAVQPGGGNQAQYQMMPVQPGGNQVQYQMMAVQPGGGNQAQFGNQQGPFTYLMQPVFVQQPMPTSYIPNLVPGGASSDA